MVRARQVDVESLGKRLDIRSEAADPSAGLGSVFSALATGGLVMRYRVSLEVQAESPDEAETIARGVFAVSHARVTLLDPPADRHDHRHFYVQPLPVLNLAWDEYMDRTLPPELRTDSRTPRLPTLADLGRAGVGPAGLSMLFDLAITAFEQGSRYRNRYQESDDDPMMG